MENKGIVSKEKKVRRLFLMLEKTKKSNKVSIVKNVDKVEKNDELMKKLSRKDLNSDERDFAFKDLTNSQLDSLCHAVTQQELVTHY